MLRVHCIGENASDPGFRSTIITAVAIDYSSNRRNAGPTDHSMSGRASHASGRGTGLPIQAPIHGVAEEGPLKILATDSFCGAG